MTRSDESTSLSPPVSPPDDSTNPVDASPPPRVNNNKDDDDDSSVVSRLLSHFISSKPAPQRLSSMFSDDDDEDAYVLARQSMSMSFSDRGHENNAIDFLLDDPKEMTYARRMALGLQHKAWYNPSINRKKPKEDEQPDGGDPLQTPSHAATTTTSTNGDRHPEDYGAKSPQTFSEITHTSRKYPSLERAWAYFEHVALPRYIFHAKPDAPKKNILTRAVRKMSKANKPLERAEPGERDLPTKLYDPIFTPLKQMGDFGLGIGLYFSTLRAITVLTLLAGLLNIPNFIYYSSEEYSDGQDGAFVLIKGSAICTRREWEPCVDCQEDDFEDNRIGMGTYLDASSGTIYPTIPFAVRNACDGATVEQGFINYTTLLFILFGIILMNRFQRHMEIKFDEDEQTAQDYSIVITNPPPTATEPEEWKRFFYDNFDGAHVTACTVAVDNDFLVRSLVERRECMRKIEMMLEPGTSLDTLTLARIAAQTERDRTVMQTLLAMVSPGIPEFFARVTVLTAKVQGLAQQNYPATNVFVSFETEEAQRKVLTDTSVGTLKAKRNKTAAVAPHCLFRGEHVLLVKEPDEPSTVRWQDLNVKMLAKLKQLFTTTMATVLAIVVIALIIQVINDRSAAFAAIAIAVFNGIFPIVAKMLTNFEAHAAEGFKQTSLYFKIAAFRWVNTAIVITIVTPFLQTLEEDGLINSIYAIFFAEIVTTNAIQLLDPAGHLERHFLAPRAATQDLMNLHMQGAVFELAERYTNMTKILFLALWYCSIFPGALFFCSFTLLVNFFVDRFSLMRTWKRAPQLGTRISKFSRRYFFSSAIVAMAVVSAFYWSGFPYDNLCENESTIGDYLGGNVPANMTWEITTGGGMNTTETTVSSTDPTYRYCLQDMFRTEGRNFPALSRNQPKGDEWMSDDQETVVDVYGWTSLAIMVIVALKFIWGWIDGLKGLFKGTYSPTGDVQGINFSDVSSISSYVPQVASTMFSYPLLACNSDGIDEELYDWTDPDRPYSYYDLTKDADALLKGMDMTSMNVFSRLVHWPPEKKKKKEDEKVAGEAEANGAD